MPFVLVGDSTLLLYAGGGKKRSARLYLHERTYWNFKGAERAGGGAAELLAELRSLRLQAMKGDPLNAIVVWSMNDITTSGVAKGQRDKYFALSDIPDKVTSAAFDLLAEMKLWDRVLLVSPGSARLWGLEDVFNDNASILLAPFRAAGIPVINGLALYEALEGSGDGWHFKFTESNVEVWAKFVADALDFFVEWAHPPRWRATVMSPTLPRLPVIMPTRLTMSSAGAAMSSAGEGVQGEAADTGGASASSAAMSGAGAGAVAAAGAAMSGAAAPAAVPAGGAAGAAMSGAGAGAAAVGGAAMSGAAVPTALPAGGPASTAISGAAVIPRTPTTPPKAPGTPVQEVARQPARDVRFGQPGIQSVTHGAAMSGAVASTAKAEAKAETKAHPRDPGRPWSEMTADEEAEEAAKAPPPVKAAGGAMSAAGTSPQPPTGGAISAAGTPTGPAGGAISAAGTPTGPAGGAMSTAGPLLSPVGGASSAADPAAAPAGGAMSAAGEPLPAIPDQVLRDRVRMAVENAFGGIPPGTQMEGLPAGEVSFELAPLVRLIEEAVGESLQILIQATAQEARPPAPVKAPPPPGPQAVRGILRRVTWATEGPLRPRRKPRPSPLLGPRLPIPSGWRPWHPQRARRKSLCAPSPSPVLGRLLAAYRLVRVPTGQRWARARWPQWHGRMRGRRRSWWRDEHCAGPRRPHAGRPAVAPGDAMSAAGRATAEAGPAPDVPAPAAGGAKSAAGSGAVAPGPGGAMSAAGAEGPAAGGPAVAEKPPPGRARSAPPRGRGIAAQWLATRGQKARRGGWREKRCAPPRRCRDERCGRSPAPCGPCGGRGGGPRGGQGWWRDSRCGPSPPGGRHHGDPRARPAGRRSGMERRREVPRAATAAAGRLARDGDAHSAAGRGGGPFGLVHPLPGFAVCCIADAAARRPHAPRRAAPL